MKNFKFLVASLVLTSFAITSCSDDDDNTNVALIVGNYELQEVNTQAPTDFNEDGTSNTNQMLESNCYDGSELILYSDQAFTYEYATILIDESTGSTACATDTFTGTWQLISGAGEDAVIEATYENASGDDVTVTLFKEGNDISFTQSGLFSQYPDRDDAGGAIYTNGSVEYVFTR